MSSWTDDNAHACMGIIKEQDWSRGCEIGMQFSRHRMPNSNMTGRSAGDSESVKLASRSTKRTDADVQTARLLQERWGHACFRPRRVSPATPGRQYQNISLIDLQPKRLVLVNDHLS